MKTRIHPDTPAPKKDPWEGVRYPVAVQQEGVGVGVAMCSLSGFWASEHGGFHLESHRRNTWKDGLWLPVPPGVPITVTFENEVGG